MAVFHLKLLVLLTMSSALPVSDCELCDPEWEYHKLSGTCLKLYKWSKTQKEADQYCRRFRGGSSADSEGHLVYIFNNETNNVVKGLMASNKVTLALIGLKYRARTKLYQWGSTNKALIYTDWKDNITSPDPTKTSVVITKDGWEQYNTNGRGSFLCEVDAVFPQPEMTCPVTEEGKDETSIECKIKVPDYIRFVALRYDRAGTSVAGCGTQDCQSMSMYETSVNIKDLTDDYIVSASLKIGTVDRHQNNTWTCSVILGDIPGPVTSHCDLKVYAVPGEITCTHRFSPPHIQAVCITEKVFPEAVCKWGFYWDSFQQDLLEGETPHHERLPGTVYYRTVCRMRYQLLWNGEYHFQISMYPNITELEDPQKGAVISTNFIVRVASSMTNPGDEHPYLPHIYIGVIIILCLVIIVLVAAILVCRRRNAAKKKSSANAENELTLMRQPGSSARPGEHKTDGHEDNRVYITPVTPDYLTNKDLFLMGQSSNMGDYLVPNAQQEDDNGGYLSPTYVSVVDSADTGGAPDTDSGYIDVPSDHAAVAKKTTFSLQVIPEPVETATPHRTELDEVQYETIK